MPRRRIVVHAAVPTPSAANASTPPWVARRHVNNPPTPPAGVVATRPLARAWARRRSSRPVSNMMGKPSNSSTTAPASTQSGRPRKRTSR